MAKKLIKWKNGEKPTGSYASFHYWCWPMAYHNDTAVVQIVAQARTNGNAYGYQPYYAKNPAPCPLNIMVRVDTETGWEWRYLKGAWPSLIETKAAAEAYWEKHADLLPKVKE